MGLLEKYKTLHEAAISPRSADCGFKSAFHFKKYCKRCSGGLLEPKRNSSRIIRGLFRRGYCSEECRSSKLKREGFPKSIKSSRLSNPLRNFPQEKSAFASAAIKRATEKMSSLQKSIVFAECSFNLISEKLSYLESTTGETWSRQRYYYNLQKAGV